MRTHHRLIGATTAALLAAGAVTGVSVSGAEAASARTVHASTTQAQTQAHYRATRTAQLRRMASTSATLTAVTKAVRASEYTEGVPASSYTVRDLRMSGAWARVTLRPVKNADLDPATVVLHKTGNRWTVAALGTAEVGCGIAPASTLSALMLSCD